MSVETATRARNSQEASVVDGASEGETRQGDWMESGLGSE